MRVQELVAVLAPQWLLVSVSRTAHGHAKNPGQAPFAGGLVKHRRGALEVVDLALLARRAGGGVWPVLLVRIPLRSKEFFRAGGGVGRFSRAPRVVSSGRFAPYPS